MAKLVEVIPVAKDQRATKDVLCTAACCQVSTICEEQMGSLAAQQQSYT